MATSGSFNLPFSVHLTKRYPVDSRFVVDTTASLLPLGTTFAGLGPIWVQAENWYYYFDTQTTYKRWPDEIGAGSGSTSDFLYKNLSVTFKGQVSFSVDSSYSTHFLLVENLIYKKDEDYIESLNGLNKYVLWDNSNGILEEEDKVILVYKTM